MTPSCMSHFFTKAPIVKSYTPYTTNPNIKPLERQSFIVTFFTFCIIDYLLGGVSQVDRSDQVMDLFSNHMSFNVIRVDAEEIFLEKLRGVQDPEEKRKIIGNTFIQVFEEHARKLDNVKWLAQGTIYPDVIESA